MRASSRSAPEKRPESAQLVREGGDFASLK
jgi:hypothetical protein